MRFLKILLIILLSLQQSRLCGQGQEAGLAEVYFKKIIYLDKGTLSLADGIQSSSDKELLELLKVITLPAEPDELTLYPMSGLRRLLANSYYQPIITVGSQLLILPVKSSEEKDSWWYEKLGGFLAESLPADIISLGVKIEAVLDLPEKPDFDVSFTFVSPYSLKIEPFSGRSRLQVLLPASGRRFNIDLKLHPYVAALVPRSLIKAGQKFGLKDLTEKIVDLKNISEEILLSNQASLSYTALKELKPGEPIALKKITKALFVKAGERVTIVFIKKNLRIEIWGRALVSGGLDEVVKVKPDGISKTFEGIISGEGEVLVEL